MMPILRSILARIRHLMDFKRQCDINRLLVRSARRCFRDLRHAVACIDDPGLRAHYQERIAIWSRVFWDSAHYRDELYQQLDEQEKQIKRLEDQLRSLGHTPVTETIPF